MDWMQSNSDAIAIWSADVRLTYRELDALISCATCDAAPFIAHRSIETIVRFFALWRQGRTAIPLSPRLPTQGIEAAIEATTGCKGDIAALFFTSGTTSAPKIACHTMRSLLHSARGAIDLLDIKRGDRYLLDLPLNHVGGIGVMLRTFLAGATLLLPGAPLQPTHISLVPTQLHRMLGKKEPFTEAKCLLIGGAAAPLNLLQRAAHLPIYRSYGMTETASMVVVERPNRTITDFLPGAELKIESDEIFVRGPMLFKGYFRKDADPFLPLIDGWFATGDRGRIIEGRFEWLGRKDRQFSSGGENIHPEEIEAALLELPGVLEAYIRPKPDEEFGSRITASLFCEGVSDLKEIEKALRERVAGYKIPKEWNLLAAPLKAT